MAQVLVSGDRDLLAIAAEFEQASGCPILTLDALFGHPLALGLLQNLSLLAPYHPRGLVVNSIHDLPLHGNSITFNIRDS